MFAVPTSLAPILRRLHVCRSWFVRTQLDGKYEYFHAGSGIARLPINGEMQEFIGVSDPWSRKVVSMEDLTFPDFHFSTVSKIVLHNPDSVLYQNIFQNPQRYEGVPCNRYFACLDQETGQPVSDLINLFPGYITSPEAVQNDEKTDIYFNIASVWENMNFPVGGRWNHGDRLAKNSSDWIFRWVGHKASEGWL